MEKRTRVLDRIPPGDKWEYTADDKYKDEILPSLTHAIEFCFLETGIRRYYVDAEDGAVYSIEDVPDPPPPTYSIYGDYTL